MKHILDKIKIKGVVWFIWNVPSTRVCINPTYVKLKGNHFTHSKMFANSSRVKHGNSFRGTSVSLYRLFSSNEGDVCHHKDEISPILSAFSLNQLRLFSFIHVRTNNLDCNKNVEYLYRSISFQKWPFCKCLVGNQVL